MATSTFSLNTCQNKSCNILGSKTRPLFPPKTTSISPLFFDFFEFFPKVSKKHEKKTGQNPNKHFLCSKPKRRQICVLLQKCKFLTFFKNYFFKILDFSKKHEKSEKNVIFWKRGKKNKKKRSFFFASFWDFSRKNRDFCDLGHFRVWRFSKNLKKRSKKGVILDPSFSLFACILDPNSLFGWASPKHTSKNTKKSEKNTIFDYKLVNSLG